MSFQDNTKRGVIPKPAERVANGRHAAEWTVLRVVKDRAYKFHRTESHEWGVHRNSELEAQVKELVAGIVGFYR